MKTTFVFSNVGQLAAENFKTKAQFTLLDLRKATKHNTEDLISMEKLIVLLEHHNILAPLPVPKDTTEVTYFMPSILKSATKEELSQISPSPDIAPIMYRYKSGYLPLGVFSSLIIAIICKQKQHWSFQEDDPCRNKISFLVGKDYDTVTIINCVHFIKVVLLRESDPVVPTSLQCSDIRTTIYNLLIEVNTNLKYNNARVQYGFECMHESSHPSSFHVCILEDETFTKMKCLENRIKTKIVSLKDSKQKIWFNKV